MPTSTMLMTGASASSVRARRRSRDVMCSPTMVAPWRCRPLGPRTSRSGRRSRGVGADAPAQVTLDERVEVTVEDRVWIARFDRRAQVLDHGVGLEHVGANLVAPARLDVLAPKARHLGLALLDLPLDQLGAQDRHGSIAVLVLAALGLHRHDDPGGQV